MPSKYRILGAVALAVAVALAATYALWDSRSAEPGFRLGKVERGPIVAAVSATGTVNPVISVQVGSQVSGQIKELYVDFNSEVRKNQVIARIDPMPFELRVKQASADLEATRTTVLTQRATVGAMRAEASRQRITADDAGRDYERKKSLYEKNFVSIADRDKAQATYDAAREAQKTAEAQVKVGEAQVANAEAVVRQREAALASAQVDLEHTYIRAPVDGVVISRNVDAGQTVAASLQAPVLFMIAQNLQDMQVDTSIDEADVGRIRLGQAATFTVDSFPGRIFNGKVSQVRKAAQVVQNVVTYTVVVATANPDLTLLPGMTANVRIVTDIRDSVLKLPNAALRFRPAGSDAKEAAAPAAEAAKRDPAAAKAVRGTSTSRIYVLDERGQPKPVGVRLGLSDGSTTELVGAELAEGTQVVIGTAPAGRNSTAPTGGPRPGF
jgi:HlyD family secretion protein